MIDHPSLTENVDQLLGVDQKTGFLNLDEIINLKDDVGLLSLAGINSQLGVIQPFVKIKKAVSNLNKDRASRGVEPLRVHVDSSQMGFVHQLSPQSIRADLITYNSGKVGGPKQAGFFYCQDDINLEAVLRGGKQESGLRPGTESIQQIYGTTIAFEAAILNQKTVSERLTKLQSGFEAKLKQIGAEIVLESSRRSPHIVTCFLPTPDSEAVVLKLSQVGIYVGLGSACQLLDRDETLSKSALVHLGFDQDKIKTSCRFSFGPTTTADQLHRTINQLQLIL